MGDGSGRAPVVLVGLDTIQGLQAARIYARSGIPVIGVVSDPDYYASKTRVCCEVVALDGRDPVEVLAEIAERHQGPMFLLPCHDRYLLPLARGRARLEAHYRLSLPPAEVVEMLSGKASFARFATAHRIEIPTTFVIESAADLGPAIAGLPFPVAVKPDVRTSEWMRLVGEKAVRVEDARVLEAFVDRWLDLAGTLIVQDWIEGTDADLYSCNGYFVDGAPLATFTAKKLRQWPPRAGQSCLGVEVRSEGTLEATLALAAAVGFTGLLYVETKQAQGTSDLYVVEPNVGRPTGRSAIAEAGGVELLMTAYCHTMGLELPEARTQRYVGVKWIHLLRDLRSAWYYMRHGELSLAEWLRSLSGPKSYAVWSVRDPLPFLHAVVGVMRKGGAA